MTIPATSPAPAPVSPERRRAVLAVALLGLPLYALWFSVQAVWDDRRALGDWFWDTGLAPTPSLSLTMAWVVPALVALVLAAALWLPGRAVLAGRSWGRVALTVLEPAAVLAVLLVEPVWRHLAHGDVLTVTLVGATVLAVATSLALLWWPRTPGR